MLSSPDSEGVERARHFVVVKGPDAEEAPD